MTRSLRARGAVLTLVEQTVEIDVDGVATRRIQEDVFAVSVSQAEYVSHHGYDGRRPYVRGPSYKPALQQIQTVKDGSSTNEESVHRRTRKYRIDSFHSCTAVELSINS